MNPHTYPIQPSVGVRDTSRQSAEAIAPRVPTLRERALELIRQTPRTADECADIMSESILAIRPRVAECVAMGDLVDSGVRRKNSSGRSAIVWKAVEAQSSLFDVK